MRGKNQLDAQRTLLANERTVLAYVRTALAFVATGIIIMHFFSGGFKTFASFIIILIGVIILVVGLFLFFARKKMI